MLLHPRDTYPIETGQWDDWEKATVQQRHLAVAADAELRRRHPDEHYPPLRSAEPEPVTSDQREELTMTAGDETRETGQWIKDLAAAHRAFADRLSLAIPSQDPDYGDLGQAFPSWPGPGHGAILRSPKPEIRPSPQILQRAADRDADFEAAVDRYPDMWRYESVSWLLSE